MARPGQACAAADHQCPACVAVASDRRWDRLLTLAAVAMPIDLRRLDSRGQGATLTAQAHDGWVRPMVHVQACDVAATAIVATVTTTMTMIARRAPGAAARHRAALIETARIRI